MIAILTVFVIAWLVAVEPDISDIMDYKFTLALICLALVGIVWLETSELREYGWATYKEMYNYEVSYRPFLTIDVGVVLILLSFYILGKLNDFRKWMDKKTR